MVFDANVFPFSNTNTLVNSVQVQGELTTYADWIELCDINNDSSAKVGTINVPIQSSQSNNHSQGDMETCFKHC